MIPLNHLQKRITTPLCPENHLVYVESVCESIHSIHTTCNTNANPPDTKFISYPCQPLETCIQFYVPSPDPNQELIPHSQCINGDKIRVWDNHDDPEADTCSYNAGYASGPTPVEIEIAFIVYDNNNLPIQVNKLVAYYKGNLLKENYSDSNNYYAIIPGYNEGETIKYCFNAGEDTRSIVTAHATAQKFYLLSDPGAAEFLDPL
ncbi:hypothetical protein GLOIN_2v523274 [Rhizophagus clarus]|uniref:Uncharacterized protein n=1 Tax=Rhizophagus clarus TaxID=94130 RepID=A0A8H3QZD4_9GLOM|nr:hypothetical protein GLOIN_2v523274 [Rhizophagus clarus]